LTLCVYYVTRDRYEISGVLFTSKYMTDDGRSSGIPSKRWYLSIKVHVVTTQKVLILTVPALQNHM
jgi:hypothetical protein